MERTKDQTVVVDFPLFGATAKWDRGAWFSDDDGLARLLNDVVPFRQTEFAYEYSVERTGYDAANMIGGIVIAIPAETVKDKFKAAPGEIVEGFPNLRRPDDDPDWPDDIERPD